MTFESLQNANKEIKTTDIKGKEYAEVNQRIKAFRMLCPNGAITTEITSLENGVCVIKASVLDEDGRVLGTGHAYEKEGSTFINKTSYIENCETSAVGRALAMCGIGIDVSVASFEEVTNAISNQAPDEKHIKALKDRCKNEGIDDNFILLLFKINSWDDMTMDMYNTTIAKWGEVVKRWNARQN